MTPPLTGIRVLDVTRLLPGGAVIAEFGDLFVRRTRQGWMEVFEGRDVCVAPVKDLDEALDDEQVRHRAMVVEEELPSGGAMRHVGNPVKVGPSRGGEGLRRPAPGLGEHTHEVLEETGFDRAAVARLEDSGAV